MNTTVFHQANQPFELEPKPTVRALIAYEDRDTGMRARDFFERMVRQFGEDCDFQHKLLDLDVLSVAGLRDTAADEAADADMILLACHGDGELSRDVKQWCEDWLARSWKGDAALVALFDEGSEASSGRGPAREFLEGIARRAGMTFIPHTMPRPVTQLTIEFSAPPRPSCRASADRLYNVETWPRWGINE